MKSWKRHSLYVALTRLAWGYGLLYLQLVFRGDRYLDLVAPEYAPALEWWEQVIFALPYYLGYIPIIASLPGIALCERSAKLLRPLGWTLLALEGARWLYALCGGSSGMWFGYVYGVLLCVLTLYFHFQLLTNLANIAGHFSRERAHNLRLVRTLSLIVITLCSLPLPIADLGWDPWLVTGIILIIAAFLILTARNEILGLRREIVESICTDTEVESC